MLNIIGEQSGMNKQIGNKQKLNIQRVAVVAEGVGKKTLNVGSGSEGSKSGNSSPLSERKGGKEGQREIVYPTAEAYKQYDQRTHVYMKPDMYIGTDEKVIREAWVYDRENKKMVNKTIDFVPGCERLFLEILTNASDNVGRSRRAGVDPGDIEIMMDNSTISMKNYGLPMPIEIHPKEGVYVPQMILGSLLTSSNYEVDRHEAGTNGIGAKATNIFSKEFMVIVEDNIRNKKYIQIWNNNMKERSEPQIEEYKGEKSSVQIVYKMDFERFKYGEPKGKEGGYPEEVYGLYCRHAVDISFTAKTRVIFNGEEFNCGNIRDYARLYFGEAVDTAIVHYQWPVGTEIITKKKGNQVAKNGEIIAEVELIAIDTPDEGSHVSFVNCMMTHDGGVHVNAAVKAVGDSAVQMINESVIKRMIKMSKGKELAAKDKRAHTITINDVKPHMSILLNIRVVNPKFTSQTKTCLGAPTPKIEIGEEELKGINKWQLIDRLYAALEAKQFASLAKTDGKLKKYVRLTKGVDANNAGKGNRHRCVLYITEGKSGAGYANKLMSLVTGGRDNIGVLPMRGKSLNVMNADRIQIEKNAEINELKKMLGLVDSADPKTKDTYYLDNDNFDRLRYGAIMIMADSDVDGKHIIGLILNFFYCRFPSLLARGYVMYYRTPTLRVSHGSTTHKFYTQREYEEWKNQTGNYQNWTHKYYKGLGTSNDKEVADDYKTPRVVNCLYDAEAPEAMKLAFDKDRADQRKDWIGNWSPMLGVEDIQMQPISWFIKHELILFSIAAIHRAIPKLTDGLKESHRKILHGAHKKWKIGSKKTEYKEVKVAQFAAYVAGNTHYQHGEEILGDVVIGMAQDFTGSNNIGLLMKNGQFGTRFEGGKDAAAARYPCTCPEKLTSYIFRKEDRPVLKHLIEEGDEVEPETYWPVIPMILVNGGYGIGVGYSSFVPNHDPLLIMKILRLKLEGVEEKDLPDLFPWYRGFTGVIKVIDRRQRKKRAKVQVTTITTAPDGSALSQIEIVEEVIVEEVEEEEDMNEELIEGLVEEDEIVEKRPLLSMITYGKFHKGMDGTIFITEMPIGRWPINYHKWLEQLVDDKKITGFSDRSVDNTVYFEIYGFTDVASYLTLKLRRTMGMSNMVLLDERNYPVRYDTAYDVFEAFYERRLPIYQKRKDYILGHLAEEIVSLTHKITFIRAVISTEILIINRKISQIHEAMDKLNIPHAIYETSKTRNLSEDDIETLLKQIKDKQDERDVIEQTPITKMWLADIDELEAKYRSVYSMKQKVLSLVVPKKSKYPEEKNMRIEEVQKERRGKKTVNLNIVV